MSLRVAAVRVCATALACLVGVGCGEDSSDPPPATGGGGVGGSGGGGGSTPVGPGAVLPCPPGELLQDDGSCLPPGIPSDGCGQGFTHDGDSACAPVLPADRCAAGSLAVPGDATCRPVTACVGGRWGGIQTEPTTQYVDGSYGGTSTGSEAQPWKTVQEGVDAAAVGAIVAITTGTYGERVNIDQSVTLWGACPADVTIASPGAGAAVTVTLSAGTVVLRDLGLTSQLQGLWSQGASSVTLERVWMHDVLERGMVVDRDSAPSSVVVRDSLIETTTLAAIELNGAELSLERSLVRDVQYYDGWGIGVAAYRAAGQRAQLTVRGSVIEGSPGLGVFAYGSDLVIEDSVVRDTHAREDDTQGLGVLAKNDGAERALATVRGSLVETSHFCGICADDSDLVVERTVIRDIEPEPTGLLLGVGIRVYAFETTFATRPFARIEQTVVERTHDVGLQIGGAEAEVTALLVRDVAGRRSDGQRGRGITVGFTVGTSERRGQATIRGCRIERAHEAGIMVAGADGEIDSCAVIDTLPRELDGLLGGGIAFVAELSRPEQGATGSIRRTVVERARAGGINVAASDLSVSDVIVRETLRMDQNDDFGDGLVASSSMVLLPDFYPTSLDIQRATVEHNSRAAVAAFGAPVGIEGSLLDCNPIDLNGEEDVGAPFSIEDLGGNVCGCGADLRQCTVLSSGLEPPPGF